MSDTGSGTLSAALRAAVTVAGLMGVGVGAGGVLVARGEVSAQLARAEERALATDVRVSELRDDARTAATAARDAATAARDAAAAAREATDALRAATREPRRRAAAGSGGGK